MIGWLGLKQERNGIQNNYLDMEKNEGESGFVDEGKEKIWCGVQKWRDGGNSLGFFFLIGFLAYTH